MRHVPLAEFQDNVSDLIAAAEGGEEIVITREGREVAKLVAMADADRKARQRAAVEAMYALGQQIKAKHGPTTAEEIREWLEEGRR